MDAGRRATITRAFSWVIGLIDPAERYLWRHFRRRPSRRWGVYRVATPALRPSREEIEQMIAEYEATLRAAERRYGGQVRACAQELLRTGATVVRLQTVQLSARIVSYPLPPAGRGTPQWPPALNTIVDGAASAG